MNALSAQNPLPSMDSFVQPVKSTLFASKLMCYVGLQVGPVCRACSGINFEMTNFYDKKLIYVLPVTSSD